jgi:hypothetical protein
MPSALSIWWLSSCVRVFVPRFFPSVPSTTRTKIMDQAKLEKLRAAAAANRIGQLGLVLRRKNPNSTLIVVVALLNSYQTKKKLIWTASCIHPRWEGHGAPKNCPEIETVGGTRR